MSTEKKKAAASSSQQLSDILKEFIDSLPKSSCGKLEVQTLRSKVEYLTSKVSELESQNDSLENRIKELEAELQQDLDYMRAIHDMLKVTCDTFQEGRHTGKRKLEDLEAGESSTSATQLPSTAKSDVDDVTGKPYNKGSTEIHREDREKKPREN